MTIINIPLSEQQYKLITKYKAKRGESWASYLIKLVKAYRK